MKNDLRTIAETTRRAMGATGLAIGVIEDDRSQIATVGHEHEGGAAIKPDTLFGIGSLTKAQTAYACLAAGVPLPDPVPQVVTRQPISPQATLEDLLSGRTGRRHRQEIPLRAVFETRDTYLAVALRLPLEEGAGREFRYSNAMFTLAGAVLEDRSGLPWDRALRDHVWTRLGMEGARAFNGRAPDGPAAMPHVRDAMGEMAPAGWGFFGREMEEAAGAVLTSAQDMLCWLRPFAGLGRDTARALAAEALRPRIVANEEDPLANLAALAVPAARPCAPAYGLGWFLHHWRDQGLASHSGGFGGFSAYMAVQPRARRAAILLSNARAARPILEAAALSVLDGMAGRSDTNWPALALALPPRPDFFALPDMAPRPVAATPNDLPIGGRYRTDVLGPIIEIRRTDDGPHLRCGRMDGRLQMCADGRFLLTASGVLERPLQDILTFGDNGRTGRGDHFPRFSMWAGLTQV